MTLIRHELNSWLDAFNASNSTFFTPDIELSEDRENYELKVELPGLKKEEIEINLTGSVLSLKGEKKEVKETKDKKFYHSERRYGSFQRVIEFPTEVKSDQVKATYVDGILELVIPKAESAKPKQIKVDVK